MEIEVTFQNYVYPSLAFRKRALSSYRLSAVDFQPKPLFDNSLHSHYARPAFKYRNGVDTYGTFTD